MAAPGGSEAAHLERLLRVTTCLATCGYGTQVGALMCTARAFYGDAQVWDAHVQHTGVRRRTYLMHAALKGNAARVQFLLDRGAAVNVASVSSTALTLAAQNGHLETVRCLVAPM